MSNTTQEYRRGTYDCGSAVHSDSVGNVRKLYVVKD